MATIDFTVADVLAWARTKPADEAYDYCDSGGCAVAQFGLETGRDYLVGLSATELRAVSGELEAAVVGFDDCKNWARTFGGLVKRLELICPETPITPSNWLSIDAYLTDIEQVSA